MQKLSLDALARELVGQAAGGKKPGDSRVSRTVVGGHEKALRQTVIALAKDAALAEHASPGEATVLVLRGRVTLAAGGESWEGREGDLIIVPDAPHSLTAQADSAVLLTVVKRLLPVPGPSRLRADWDWIRTFHRVSPLARARIVPSPGLSPILVLLEPRDRNVTSLGKRAIPVSGDWAGIGEGRRE
ncbi:MAG TPA: cupin domain-containing protein [Trebonia sp.]